MTTLHETVDYMYLRLYIIECTDLNTVLPKMRLADDDDNASWGLDSVDNVLCDVHVVNK